MLHCLWVLGETYSSALGLHLLSLLICAFLFLTAGVVTSSTTGISFLHPSFNTEVKTISDRYSEMPSEGTQSAVSHCPGGELGWSHPVFREQLLCNKLLSSSLALLAES